MKLYELPRNRRFTLNEQPKQPPDILYEVDILKVYTLHHIDGMYSYVTDIDGNIYHFAAWTEVTPYDREISRIDIIGQNGNTGEHYETEEF